MSSHIKRGKRCFIDTNVFLRTLVREDPRVHEESLALMRAIRIGKVYAYTSPTVLAEVLWVLQSFYKLPKQETIDALYSIVRLRHLKIESHEQVPVALELYEHHSIKFIDALIASDGRILQGTLPLVSYDKEFNRVPGVVRYEPKELL